MIKFEWLFFELLIMGLAFWELYALSRDKKKDAGRAKNGEDR